MAGSEITKSKQNQLAQFYLPFITLITKQLKDTIINGPLCQILYIFICNFNGKIEAQYLDLF